MRAIKRGGNYQLVSFDLHLPEAEAALRATPHLTDVNSYDVAWASGIVTRAWTNVRERLVAEGKGEWVDELRPFVAGGTVIPANQQEVAKRLAQQSKIYACGFPACVSAIATHCAPR